MATHSAQATQQRQPGPWQRERDAFLRAFSGAYLFGIPLLFTMEMWWLGTFIDTERMFLLVVVAFVANLGLVYTSGFKRPRDTLLARVDQVVDVMAVGIVGSIVVLLVLNRIGPDDSLQSIVGRVVVQMLPLSLGASLANAVFGRNEGRSGEGHERDARKELLKDLGATAIGATFIGSSIAPTEEIPMLAIGMGYWHMAAMVVLSLLVGYGIVFASGFDPERQWTAGQGLFQTPLTQTALSYVVALGVAFAALVLLQQIELEDPLYFVLQQTVVLGLPCTIGGAAGRLAI